MAIEIPPKVAVFLTQLPIDYATASVVDPLVINDWYTAVADLSGGKPVKFVGIIIEQTNTDVTAETIELEITLAHPVTGVMTTYTFAMALDSGTAYYGIIEYSLDTGNFTLTLTTSQTQPLWIGEKYSSHSFTVGAVGLIRTRQTTAVDAVSAYIEVNIVWEKLTAVNV